MAENALLRLEFPRIHLFRPGYIYPVTPRNEPNVWLRIFRSLYPVFRRVYPNIGVASDDLARVMVHAGLHGTGTHTDPLWEIVTFGHSLKQFVTPGENIRDLIGVATEGC